MQMKVHRDANFLKKVGVGVGAVSLAGIAATSVMREQIKIG